MESLIITILGIITGALSVYVFVIIFGFKVIYKANKSSNKNLQSENDFLSQKIIVYEKESKKMDVNYANLLETNKIIIDANKGWIDKFNDLEENNIIFSVEKISDVIMEIRKLQTSYLNEIAKIKKEHTKNMYHLQFINETLLKQKVIECDQLMHTLYWILGDDTITKHLYSDQNEPIKRRKPKQEKKY